MNDDNKVAVSPSPALTCSAAGGEDARSGAGQGGGYKTWEQLVADGRTAHGKEFNDVLHRVVDNAKIYSLDMDNQNIRACLAAITLEVFDIINDWQK